MEAFASGRRPGPTRRVGPAHRDSTRTAASRVTDQGQVQDLTAAANDVAGLISRLADDDEAIRVAAAHPGRLLAYALEHGGNDLRRMTSAAATPLFDEILQAAAAEFTELVPSSPRFVSSGLAEVLRHTESGSSEIWVGEPSCGCLLYTSPSPRDRS